MSLTNPIGGLLRGAARLPRLLAAGPDDPRLSAQQNAQTAAQAMRMAGLSLIGNRGHDGPSIGQALMGGQQVAQQARGGMAAGQALQQMKLTPQQRMAIAALPPEMQQQALAQLALGGGADPKVVGEGGALVDASGRELYRNPNAETTRSRLPAELVAIASIDLGIPEAEVPAALAALPPEQQDGLLAKWENFRRAGATNVTVDTGNKVAEGLAQIGLDEYRKVTEASTTAMGMLDQLSVLRAMIESGRMKTGAIQEWTMPLRRLGAALGIANADNLSHQEAFRAITNKLALLNRVNMPGQMSDKDREFLMQTVASIGNTPEGNLLLIEIGELMANRMLDIADEFDRYRAEHPNLEGWRRHLTQWGRANQLDLTDIRQKYGFAPAPWNSGGTR